MGRAAEREALARAVAAAYLGARASVGRLLGCGDQGCTFEAVPSRATRGAGRAPFAIKVAFAGGRRVPPSVGREALALCAVSAARDPSVRALAPAILGHASSVRAVARAGPRARYPSASVEVAADVVEMELVPWPAADSPASAAAARAAADRLLESACVDHGDLGSPGNVVASPADASSVRLLDFGVARVVGPRARTRALEACARLARRPPVSTAVAARATAKRRSVPEGDVGPSSPDGPSKRLRF